MDFEKINSDIQAQIEENEQYLKNILLEQESNFYIKENNIYKGVVWKDATYKRPLRILALNGTEKQVLEDTDIEVIMPKGTTIKEYFWVTSPSRQ